MYTSKAHTTLLEELLFSNLWHWESRLNPCEERVAESKGETLQTASITVHIVNSIYHRPSSPRTTSLDCCIQKLIMSFVHPCSTENYQRMWEILSECKRIKNHLQALNKSLKKNWPKLSKNIIQRDSSDITEPWFNTSCFLLSYGQLYLKRMLATSRMTTIKRPSCLTLLN